MEDGKFKANLGNLVRAFLKSKVQGGLELSAGPACKEGSSSVWSAEHKQSKTEQNSKHPIYNNTIPQTNTYKYPQSSWGNYEHRLLKSN